MWAAILEILKNLFGFLKSKKDKELEEFKIQQGEEFKKAKTAQEAARIRDEHEKLVAQANSDNKAVADKALEEIRRRLGK
jgi:hypothetical protein